MKNTLRFTILILFIYYPYKSTWSQELWGMTRLGGEYNKGVIFKMNEDASEHETVFSFKDIGMPEGRMTEYSDGIFYGMTSVGRGSGNGIIYRFDAVNGSISKMIDFDGEQTGSDGAGAMLKASNGKLYGMTVSGGAFNKGIIFEFNPETKSISKKLDFDGNNNGSEPLGSLFEGTDGNLYGMTSMGGANDAGVIFSFNPGTGVYEKLFDFDGGENGSNPMGSLVEVGDGMLYGLTRWGGANDYGIIFKYDIGTKVFKRIFEFEGENTGRNPHGSLTASSNGKLYGLTPFGGSDNLGVLFELDPTTDIFQKKYDFRDGFIQSYGSLMEAPDNRLYGVIHNSYDYIVMMFCFDPESESLIVDGIVPDRLRDFYGSTESLSVGSNGKLYFWGRDEFYVDKEVFLVEFDYNSYNFTNYYKNSSCETGSFPIGQLVQGADKNLYGVTSRGGEFDKGVIFKIQPSTKEYSKLVDFNGLEKGAAPSASLLLAQNSKLYGMTTLGGADNKGTLFEFNQDNGEYRKLIDFNGHSNGGNPHGNLIEADNGKIYGLTSSGGSYNSGVLFEFDPITEDFNKLVDLTDVEHEFYPKEALIQASNQKIYGITKYGGSENLGKLFEYDIESGSYNILMDCDNRPGAIMQASNGNLYISGYSSIIEYNITTGIQRNIDTPGAVGNLGELFEVTENVLYGMDYGEEAYQMGIENRGMVFKIDLNDNYALEVLQFDGLNGRHPENSGLLWIPGQDEPVTECFNVTVYLDENGEAVLQPAEISTGSFDEGLNLFLSKNEFNCTDIGTQEITLSMINGHESQLICRVQVTVADTLAPVVQCKNLTIYLDDTGVATVNVNEVDNGSYDACGIEMKNLEQTVFTTENVGDNPVVLTVTDVYGNSATCELVVTVVDTIPPEVICNDLVVYLDESGTAEISAADLSDVLSDDDDIKSKVLDLSNFGPDDLGANLVKLTITDILDNVSICTVNVEVRDSIVPIIFSSSEYNLYLDPYQTHYSFDVSALEAEATDNSGALAFSYSINGIEYMAGQTSGFPRLQEGIHEITWIATDESKNVSTSSSILSVLKRPTELIVYEKEVDVKSGIVYFEAVLKDDLLDKGIENKSIVFELNSFKEVAFTDEEGIARVSFPVSDQIFEPYNLSVSFEEDITYTGIINDSEVLTDAGPIIISSVNVYPNPFKEKLNFEFIAPIAANARVDIFDASGRLVSTIFNQPVESGLHYKAVFEPQSESTGVYFYRMMAGTWMYNGKIVFTK